MNTTEEIEFKYRFVLSIQNYNEHYTYVSEYFIYLLHIKCILYILLHLRNLP